MSIPGCSKNVFHILPNSITPQWKSTYIKDIWRNFFMKNFLAYGFDFWNSTVTQVTYKNKDTFSRVHIY